VGRWTNGCRVLNRASVPLGQTDSFYDILREISWVCWRRRSHETSQRRQRTACMGTRGPGHTEPAEVATRAQALITWGRSRAGRRPRGLPRPRVGVAQRSAMASLALAASIGSRWRER
jgi:hypothetical protein